jgi:tripartite-type tricarboxylate transporter receptor subunit TctC
MKRVGMLLFALCIAAAMSARPSRASDFPTRPITLVVAFAPGGVADTVARLLANGLQTRLHQTVVVENRPGAGGNVAAGVVARSAPDGYTLLLTTTAFSINLTLNKSQQLAASNFRAVAFPASSPEVLAVNSDTDIKTLSDLIEKGKREPLNFGTAGVGSASHIMAEYFFKDVAKVAAVHIPFQGGAPEINALLGKQIDLVAAILGGGVAAQIKSGKLRGLAVASDTRTSVVPDVPTFAESGYPQMKFADWVGVFAPGKSDGKIVDQLNSEIQSVLQESDVKAKLTSMGFDPTQGTAEDAEKEFQGDVNRWADLIKSIGLILH